MYRTQIREFSWHSFVHSFSKDRVRTTLGLLAFCSLALGGTLVYLWRCQFGLDLTDEAFYLAPAWKLFGLGDKPFVNEIFNGVRQSDLLNFLFVRPWMSLSVLNLRWAAVLTYSLCLGLFTAICFHRRLGLTAGLLFVSCLTFDLFLTPTWSYNWWTRNTVLLHNAFVLLASRAESAPLRKAYTAIGGLALGVALVAYNSLFPVIGACAVYFYFLAKRKNMDSQNPLPKALYLVSVLIPLLPLAAYLTKPAVRTHWWASVVAMSSLGEYSTGGVLPKSWALVSKVFGLTELWVFGAIVLFYVSAFGEFVYERMKQKLKKAGARQQRLLSHARLWLLTPCVLYLAIRLWNGSSPLETLDAIVALGAVATLTLAIRSLRDENGYLGLVVVVTAVLSLGMALSSTNGYLAIYWVLPGLVIPFVAQTVHDFGREMRIRPPEELSFRLAGQLFILLFVGSIGWGAYQLQRTQTYYDVPPGNCLTTVNTPPFQGVRTSERRAFLVGTLARLLQDKPFVLAFADIPGPFLLGQVRSAVDTTIVEADAPAALQIRSLKHMWEQNRVPSLILRTKIHPWYWGIHHPLASLPMHYPKADPYSRFTDCARTNTLVSFPEFDVYELDPARIALCVNALS